MQSSRWFNQSQPQTLQYAVILLYINAAFGLLYLLGGAIGLLGLLVVGGGVAGAWGISNERKWGYGLGLAVAILPFIINIIFLHTLFAGGIINIAFEVLLVGLLLHTQSREYQRIWFK